MRCNILLRINGLIECFSVTYIMSVNMAIELIVVFQFAFESHMKLRTLYIVKCIIGFKIVKEHKINGKWKAENQLLSRGYVSNQHKSNIKGLL